MPGVEVADPVKLNSESLSQRRQQAQVRRRSTKLLLGVGTTTLSIDLFLRDGCAGLTLYVCIYLCKICH